MARRLTTKKASASKASSGGKIFHAKISVGKRIYKSATGGKEAPWSRSAGANIFKYKLAKIPMGAKVSVGTIRQAFGVSQEELARVTGYSTRSIAGWEGGQALSESARQKLTETERLRVALAEIMPAENLGEWLRTPNPAFEGQPPLQVIERGESDRLWRMIFQIDANVAT